MEIGKSIIPIVIGIATIIISWLFYRKNKKTSEEIKKDVKDTKQISIKINKKSNIIIWILSVILTFIISILIALGLRKRKK